MDPFREKVTNGDLLYDVPELLREAVGHLGAKPNSNARIYSRALPAPTDSSRARTTHRPAASLSIMR